MDFESATWNAVRQVLPNVSIRGCAFHWKQALWRKAQELGLQVPYRKSNGVNKFVRKLMALPYLPHQHISRSLSKMVETLPDNAVPLQRLSSYVRRRWLQNPVFPVSAWCVFGQPTRTNSDVEGWHHRLNNKANGVDLHMYLLIQLLHKEAIQLPLQRRLISERKLTRHQKAKTKSTQSRLFSLWKDYSAGNIRPSALLREIGSFVGV